MKTPSAPRVQTPSVSRFHWLLVTLHWLLAALISGALILGFVVLAAMSNADPQKIALLRLHMAGGMLILFLMIVRFVVRICTSRPIAASTGHPAVDRIAPISHYGFYALVLTMAGTGYATGILAGLPAIVFGRSGDPLPRSFDVYPTFVAHRYIALLLAALILVHLLAALYHQLVIKDGLMSRMLFGRRSSAPSTPRDSA